MSAPDATEKDTVIQQLHPDYWSKEEVLAFRWCSSKMQMSLMTKFNMKLNLHLIFTLFNTMVSCHLQELLSETTQ